MTLLESYIDLFGNVRRPVPLEDIPCHEISDSARLCKNPVVSVRMATYNHEKWIAQAIEGVVNQQTDFEYELVIGEDCSIDRTRDICLEYQKRFPDKIRVLWSESNVRDIGGGNTGRLTYRCRGEFLATCEGDDFWIDPCKLQKQVDLVRKKHVDVCVAFHEVLFPDGHRAVEKFGIPKNGMLTYSDIKRHYFHTTTYLVRKSLWMDVMKSNPRMVGWYDTILFQCFAKRGKIALLPEIVSVYRRTGYGIMTSLSLQQTWMFGVKQGLSTLLFVPEFPRKDAAELVLSRIVHLVQPSVEGGFSEFQFAHGQAFNSLFWQMCCIVFPRPRFYYSIVKALPSLVRLMKMCRSKFQ